jgi:hypothetical protein
MRAVDLAVYADSLAGEAAALAARAEQARSRLRQAAIEREARRDLSAATVAKVEARGLLRLLDDRAVRAEVAELEAALAAVEELQAWVETKLAAAREDVRAPN